MALPSDVKSIAQSLLYTKTTCRHCNETADLEYIGDGLTGVHACPTRYVTRIIKYGERVDANEFKDFVQDTVRDMEKVEKADIRLARRYAWDLGVNRKSNELILMEAYWQQSYRRTKSDSPDRLALFLCSNKDDFFVQPLNSHEKLCQNCRNKV